MIAATPSGGQDDGVEANHPHSGPPPAGGEDTNGAPPYHQLGNNIQPNTIGRRYQLYIGNLSWVCQKFLIFIRVKIIFFS